MNQIKIIFLLFFLLFWPCSLYAQDIFGLQQSNYGGLYRASYNPSVIGGSKQKFQINLGTIGSTINHRYFTFIGRNSLLYPLLVPHSTKELYGRSRTMGSLLNDNTVYLVSEIRWPSAMIALDDRQGVSFQIRSRGFIQGQNIPDPIKNLYSKRLDTESTPDLTGTWGNFGLAQHSYSEFAGSYGVQILNLKAHKLRIGATVKKIFGARSAFIQGNIDNYEIRATGGSSVSSELVVRNFSYQTGYTQENKKLKVANLFSKSQYGSGWGTDLGFTYALGSYWSNSKEAFDESPAYLIRLAGSLTDVGSITYQTSNSFKGSGFQSQKIINQTNLEVISDKGAEGFRQVFPMANDTSYSRHVQLPSMLHLEADFQLIKGFFINFSHSERLKTNTDPILDIYQPNRSVITPRFENEDSDVAFPIAFIEGNKKITIGAMAHFGPIFVGFSNLNVLFKKKEVNAMTYVGLSVWKMKRKKNKD